MLAQIINIATGKYYPWGWRVSLGLAGLPAIVLTIGGIVLPDTPNSLVERGFEAEGRKVRASPAAAAFIKIGTSWQLQRMFIRHEAMGRKTPAAADGLHGWSLHSMLATVAFREGYTLQYTLGSSWAH